MTSLLQRFLRNLSSAFDRTALPARAFSVTWPQGGSASLADDTLTISDGVNTSSLSVAGVTCVSFASQLNQAGLAVTVSPVAAACQNVGAAALVPFSVPSIPAGTTMWFSCARNPTWIFLDACAAALSPAQALVPTIPGQMTTATATSPWLDQLGEQFGGVTRNAGEGDDLYGQRIIAEVLRPKCNNIAMENALLVYTGNSATVTDVQETVAASTEYGTTRYALFDVGVNFDPLGYSGSMSEFQTVVLSIINKIRAAGTFLRTLTIVPLNAPIIENETAGQESSTLLIAVDPYYNAVRNYDGSICYTGKGVWSEDIAGTSPKLTQG